MSEPFNVPTSGGLRVILVAGIAHAAERKKQQEAEAARLRRSRGVVVFGNNTRVLMEFGDDSLQVFYILRDRQQRAHPCRHRRAADHRSAAWRRRRHGRCRVLVVSAR